MGNISRQSRLKKERYERLKAQRLCTNCGTKLPNNLNRIYCDKCKVIINNTSKLNRETRSKLNRCQICGIKIEPNMYGNTGTLCLACKMDERERNKKRKRINKEHINELARKNQKEKRDKAKANGICTRCLKTKAEQGYSTCIECRVKSKKYYKKVSD